MVAGAAVVLCTYAAFFSLLLSPPNDENINNDKNKSEKKQRQRKCSTQEYDGEEKKIGFATPFV